MSEITDDVEPDTLHTVSESSKNAAPSIRTVGGVILPSKTWVPFVAGAVGGMSGAILTAPLDVVKTRLQSDFYKERLQAAKKHGTATSRFAIWRHLAETGVILRFTLRSRAHSRDVYRFEGLRALFKGLGPTLSGVVPARCALASRN
jgi:solute carrier family 25, member 33/36